MQYPGLIGGSYAGSSYMADAERTINLYVEQTESPTGPSQAALMSAPGYRSFATVTGGPVRGIAEIGGRCFAVAGPYLYEVNAGGVATLRGEVENDGSPATFAWNGPVDNAMLVTSGDKAYGYELSTNTLTTVLSSGARMCGFLSNRFLVLDAATSTLQASDQLSTTFTPGMEAVRSLAPDPWVSMAVVHSEIWLWGERTSEVWSDTGASPFPFTPIPGAFLEQGIEAPFSASRSGSPLVWLGQNAHGGRCVWQANGFQAQRASTHGINEVLSSFSSVADATSYTYAENGHLFWVLTCPTGNQTFCLDVPAGPAGWSERLYWNTASGAYEASRISCHAYVFGKHLVGDKNVGVVYEQSSTVYTDVDGVMMRRMRQAPRIFLDGQKRFTVRSVQLVMDVGIGLATGQGDDPQVMRQTSRDGGASWGNEHWASAGAVGQYGTRVIWQPCGQARNYADRFIMTDPVPMRIVGGEIDIVPGIS